MSPLVSSFQQEVVTSTGPYTSNISFLFLSQFTVENDFGTVLDTNGECDITSSGTSCSGNACSSANNNNCYREVTSGIEAQKICIKMDCENWSASCDVDAWTVDFNYASPPIPHFRIASESCEETLLGWACDSSGWLAGRLEVKLSEYDSWGTICDDGFTDTEADVACKQMGYDYGVMLSSTFTVDGDSLQTIALDEFSCPSNAASFDACAASTTHDCSHSEDVGVDCYKSSPTFRIAPNSCTSGSCSSTSMSEGRLEVSFSDGSVWGTVCDDFFDDNAADTICREMGFSSGTMLMRDSVYDGDFSLTILMDDINCPAGSASFSSCSYEGAHDCWHFEDVGVSCIGSSSTGTTPTPPPTFPQATFCYGRWSDDLFAGTDMDYMANGETQVRGCDYSGESCDSYTFSYELVDNNGYDNIDIMITDGADCEASTSSELAAVAHYTAYGQDDVYSAMVYDHIINPTLDSDKFCIYVTCDNHVFGCDDLSLKIKMSCNLESSSTTTRTDSTTTKKISPASWTRPITSRIILFAAGIAAFLAY